MTKIRAAILLITVLSIYCGEAEPGEETRECLPSQDMTITNSSEYLINRLYIHDLVDNYNSAPVSAADMANGYSFTLPVSYGDSFYVTFIRYIFTGSSTEIAVTTADPVVIEECYIYTLHLLEEDFYVETEDNFAAKKSIADGGVNKPATTPSSSERYHRNR